MISKSKAGRIGRGETTEKEKQIMKKNTKLFLLLLLIVFVYIFAGAGIFMVIETPNEVEERKLHLQIYKEFMANNTCVTEAELEQLLVNVVALFRTGIVDVYGNHTHERQWNWDYPSALGFVATAITTIGYGNVAPSTILGQTVCMIYSMVGIPLVYWLLATIVAISSGYYSLVEKKLRYYVARIFGEALCTPKRHRIFSTIMIVVICYVLLILIPARILSLTEGWTLFEAHYFSIISLTTIGFGDYVPANRPGLNFMTRLVYKILIVLYLLMGLAFLGVLINSCMEFQKKKITKVRKILQKYNTVIRGKHAKISKRSETNFAASINDEESSASGINSNHREIEINYISKNSESNGHTAPGTPQLIQYTRNRDHDLESSTSATSDSREVGISSISKDLNSNGYKPQLLQYTRHRDDP